MKKVLKMLLNVATPVKTQYDRTYIYGKTVITLRKNWHAKYYRVLIHLDETLIFERSIYHALTIPFMVSFLKSVSKDEHKELFAQLDREVNGY